MTEQRPETPAEARYLHKGCGGVTIWDLSGGFCLKCHAEGLEMDDAEQRTEPTP